MASGIRFSGLFDGLEDSCRHSYLVFFFLSVTCLVILLFTICRFTALKVWLVGDEMTMLFRKLYVMIGGKVCEMGGRSGEGTRSAMVFGSLRVQLRLTGRMFAVPKAGSTGRGILRARETSVGLFVWICSREKYSVQASVMTCAGKNGFFERTTAQAESSNPVLVFILEWLRGIPGESYQNEYSALTVRAVWVPELVSRGNDDARA